MKPFAYHHDYDRGEQEEAQYEEELEEPLDIVSEIRTIIFLVPLLNPSAFISKHFVDFTDMLLHQRSHPLMLFVEHVLNPLPIGIRNLDRNLQLGWGFLQHIVDVLVDGLNLSADSVNGIAKGSLSRIVLTDGRLQLKSCIDPSVGRFVNVLTQLPEFRRTADNSILGIMLFNLFLDFVHHVIEVRLLLVIFDEFFYMFCSSH